MIRPATTADYDRIIALWESSVRATHHFLPEDYLLHIKSLLPSIFPQVQLYVEIGADGNLDGILGIAEKKIEMLFIEPARMRKGVGRLLTLFAVDELGTNLVDVNEQNEQAVGFYTRMGFEVMGRSETDGLGKPFPLLHMEWVGKQA